MTTYYVRTSMGNDSSAGTSPATAWLTIDKAANTVAAGDIVYIGAGVYRELVTMDTAGSSGNLITFAADITGEYTGDSGLVVISAFDNERSRAIRAGCWNMNAKEFIVVRGFIMMGTNTSSGQVLGDNATSANLAYEGCIIEKCSIIALAGTNLERNAYGITVKLGTGATPATSGLIIRNCRIWATVGISINYTGNGSANVDAKISIQNCEIIGATASSSYGISIGGTATTFSVGGITITSCTIIGMSVNGVYALRCFNTTHVIGVYNCLFVGITSTIINQSLGTSGAVVQASNRIVDSTTSILSGVSASHDTYYTYGSWLPGVMANFIWETYFGWSPYKSFEPVNISGYTDPAIDIGSIGYIGSSTDSMGNPRQMGRASPGGRMYYFDASDDAVTDPNAVWTNEANIADADPTTVATCATTGSTSSNYTFAGGTNAPASGFSIVSVQVRAYAYISSGTATGTIKIYTDALGEELGTITWTNTAITLSEWVSLSTPSGGWTLAKIQALEYKAYRSAGTGTIAIYQIQVGVISDEIAPDVGAVEARTQIVQKTSSPIEGTISGELSGAGYQDFIGVPVNASSTTITVKAKYDANYTGTLPQLVVMNIPGVADQTDTMVAAANTEETLSVTFTPTSKGVVRVRIKSNDTSATGTCHFDTLTRT